MKPSQKRFSKKALLKGFGSVLSLNHEFSPVTPSPNDHEADAKALNDDVKAITKDLASVADRHLFKTINSREFKRSGIEMIGVDEFNIGTRIIVVGVGGGGANAVHHMIEQQVHGIEYMLANTDAQHLTLSPSAKTIQLGDSGLGAGSNPEKGREAAEASLVDIRTAIDGADMLFITAGMGGGTGSGAAPVIARVAKEMGMLTVAVVTMPFDFEGGRRVAQAEAGLDALEENVDSLIVVRNDRLLEILDDDVTQDEAFAHANDVLKNVVGGISEVINEFGNVNVDFEDVRTIMGEPGKAMMGTAVAFGPDRASTAAEQAMASPLFEGLDLSVASGVLVLVTAARGSLKLSESKRAMNIIRAYASPDAHIIYGASYDDSMGEGIRVTVVATGLNRRGLRRAALPVQILRTGTDNTPLVANQGYASAAKDGSAKPDSQSMVPSAWRTNRTPDAAKVDPLASGGMDDFEIPAFLRKQAD